MDNDFDAGEPVNWVVQGHVHFAVKLSTQMGVSTLSSVPPCTDRTYGSFTGHNTTKRWLATPGAAGPPRGYECEEDRPTGIQDHQCLPVGTQDEGHITSH